MRIFRYTDYGEHDYELPDCHMGFDETLDVLRSVPTENIKQLITTSWIKHNEYGDADKRRKYLASHFVASELGLVAPGFRVMVKQRKHDGLNNVEELIARDRQLIDLHYLFCHYRYDLKFRKDDFTVNFMKWNQSHFDRDDAMNFVCIGARKHIKTEKMLGVPEHVQLRLNYFQTDKVRKHIERMNDRNQQMSGRLNDYAKSSKSRLHNKKVKSLSDDLMPLLMAKGDVSLAVDLKFSMLGEQPDIYHKKVYSKSISDSKRWFSKGHAGITTW